MKRHPDVVDSMITEPHANIDTITGDGTKHAVALTSNIFLKHAVRFCTQFMSGNLFHKLNVGLEWSTWPSG